MDEIKYISVIENIDYVKHEPHFDPEHVTGGLVQFLYDVPYFSACGVFPPRHIFNQKMAHGGGDGGMGPGASWEPFNLDEDNYRKLLQLIRETDPQSLSKKSRYYQIKFIEAPEFDGIDDQWVWLEQVCDKYRKWYHEQNRKIQNT
ncbi:MAG: hypothetical protein ABW121_11140 [Candidatus Thiodiazotropha sp. 6PLUC7]